MTTTRSGSWNRNNVQPSERGIIANNNLPWERPRRLRFIRSWPLSALAIACIMAFIFSPHISTIPSPDDTLPAFNEPSQQSLSLTNQTTVPSIPEKNTTSPPLITPNTTDGDSVIVTTTTVPRPNANTTNRPKKEGNSSTTIPVSVDDSSKTESPKLRVVPTQPTSSIPIGEEEKEEDGIPTCAILFFGLPRSFRKYVLPSIIENVLTPNRQYNCDYFVHYYHLTAERAGRSGMGGRLQPDDIWLLKDAIYQIHQTSGNHNLDVYRTIINNNTIGLNSSSTTKPTSYRHNSTDVSSMVGRIIPHVSITSDTNETFWQKRGGLVEEYLSAKDDEGNYLYLPFMEKGYDPQTLTNVLMQWHSIESVWKDMEEYQLHHQFPDPRKDAATNHTAHDGTAMPGKNYTRVAMLRSDVFYITPLDIFLTTAMSSLPPPPSFSLGSEGTNQVHHNITTDDRPPDVQSNESISPLSTSNLQTVVIPDWANYPINDRMIAGPYDAVRAWATERFPRVDEYVRNNPRKGHGLHSEPFLDEAILTPIIRQAMGYPVYQSSDVCFARVRADGGIWISDCSRGTKTGVSMDVAQPLVEGLLTRYHLMENVTNTSVNETIHGSDHKVVKCKRKRLTSIVVQLYCKFPLSTSLRRLVATARHPKPTKYLNDSVAFVLPER